MNKLNNKIDFNKHNIVVFGRDKNINSKFVQDIFYKEFDITKEVFFFDELFDGFECFPEEPTLGGTIKLRNNVIDGVKSTLVSIIIGKRRGLTLIVDFSLNALVENECIDLLRELVNTDSGCNLIITCEDPAELKDFNFDVSVDFN